LGIVWEWGLGVFIGVLLVSGCKNFAITVI